MEAVAFQDPTGCQVTVVLVNYSDENTKAVRLRNMGDKEVSSISKVIQTNPQKGIWYQEQENVEPFVKLQLPEMSVTTVCFKFKAN